jgi:hypothetical protein
MSVPMSVAVGGVVPAAARVLEHLPKLREDEGQ